MFKMRRVQGNVPECPRAWRVAVPALRRQGMGETDTKGFTLLEVMIAMAMLAIALVAVFQSQSQSVSMAGISRFHTTAPLLAQSKMAETEALETGEITAGTGDFGDEYSEYEWRIDVSDTGFEYLKRIEVTVVNNRMASNNEYGLVLYRFLNQ